MGRPRAAGLLAVRQHEIRDSPRAGTLVPQQLDVAGTEVADRIETRLERFAPGFRGLVLARPVRSPSDLERENPSLVEGDLAGGSCELDQTLVFRPAPELFRGRTPVRGLYVASASVHPGPGVHGVPGAAAAQALLADRSRARPLHALRWRLRTAPPGRA